MIAVKLDVFQLVFVFACIGTVFHNLFRYLSAECITVDNVALFFRGKDCSNCHSCSKLICK